MYDAHIPKVRDVNVQRALSPQGKYAILISWNTIVPNVPDVQGFNIYRSVDSVNWNLVNSLPVQTNNYLDDSADLIFGQDYYYKVTFIDNNSQESALDDADIVSVLTQEYDVDGFNGRLLRVSIEQIRRLNLIWQNTGEKVWFVVRQYVGQKCPRCYDFNTHKARDPRCPVCFGTGIENGYKAVEGYLHIAPATAQYIRAPEGFIPNYVVVAYTGVYPLLTSNDFVIRTRTGERFFINSVDVIINQGFVLMQTVRMQVAEKGHAIYDWEVV